MFLKTGIWMTCHQMILVRSFALNPHKNAVCREAEVRWTGIDAEASGRLFH